MKGVAVYRVFEALDELGAIVEEARGVPMTAGCVVPRGDVLELIDDIKDAIPGELDDAQDVLDARDSLLREAKEHHETVIGNSNAEAEQTLSHARNEADRLLADAKAQADRMVAEARNHAEQTVGEARKRRRARLPTPSVSRRAPSHVPRPRRTVWSIPVMPPTTRPCRRASRSSSAWWPRPRSSRRLTPSPPG